MRLIDAEPLIKFCTYCADDVIVTIDRNTMAKMLAHAPEIDAVPVVRCKDCKHNYSKKHNKHYNHEDIVCDYFETDGLNDDDFCSYGERKDDE